MLFQKAVILAASLCLLGSSAVLAEEEAAEEKGFEVSMTFSKSSLAMEPDAFSSALRNDLANVHAQLAEMQAARKAQEKAVADGQAESVIKGLSVSVGWSTTF